MQFPIDSGIVPVSFDQVLKFREANDTCTFTTLTKLARTQNELSFTQHKCYLSVVQFPIDSGIVPVRAFEIT